MRSNVREWLAIFASLLLVQGCGGGDESADSEDTEEPPGNTSPLRVNVSGLTAPALVYRALLFESQESVDDSVPGVPYAVTVNSNGVHTFPDRFPDGSVVFGLWEFTVDRSQWCWPGEDTVVGPDAAPLQVDCRAWKYIGGTVSGLAGSGLRLEIRPPSTYTYFEILDIEGNGPFQGRDAIRAGDSYSVSISQQPTDPAQECFVENGEGTVDDTVAGHVSDVKVICPSPYRSYRFDNERTRMTDMPLASGEQSAGELYRTHTFGDGPAVPLGSIAGLDTTDLFQVHIDNDGADGVVYSNESGKTFWAAAESPSFRALAQGGTGYHNITDLTTWWLFRKDSATARLQFEVSEVYLLGFDDTHSSQATGRLYAEGQLWVRAFRRSDEGEFTDEVFSRHGGVALQGKLLAPGAGTDWSLFTAVDPEAQYGLWRVDDFYFDLFGDEAGLAEEQVALASLENPIPIPIDISAVPVGEQFYVNARTLVLARNSFSPEGGTVVFLRDPATFEAGAPSALLPLDDPGSVRIVKAEGVTMLGLDSLPQPASDAGALNVLACDAGLRSTFEFDETQYRVSEGSENSTRIRILRTGTPAGLIAARVRIAAGSATEGADFESRLMDVFFGDGDNLPRTLELPIVDDDVIEPDEDLTLTLLDPRGCAQIGAQDRATVTILDDDTPPDAGAYTLGGSVTGLVGSGLSLTRSSTDELQIAGNGAFAFANQYATGVIYNVRVATQPLNPRQRCTVAGGEGIISGADVGDILVTCETLPESGGLDPTFGVGGRANAGAFPAARAMALQPDGRILLLGFGKLGRYDINGQPDVSFGTNGEVPVRFYTESRDRLNALAVQPDGQIVIAGYSSDGANSPVMEDFIAARYDANGNPDAGFDGDGQVITDFESRSDGAENVLVQADGRIILTGNAGASGSSGGTDFNFAVARYNTDGALDAGFDGDGRAHVDIAGVTDLGYASVLQPDGRIVIGGRVAASGGADPDVGLARFNTDGTIDTTFGTQGIMRDQTLYWDEAAGMVLQPDGKFVVVGQTTEAGPRQLLIARYNNNGTADTTFGLNGRVTGSQMWFGRAVALQADGSIVVTGDTGQEANDFVVSRYTPTGELDTSFGTGGSVVVDFFGGYDVPAAIAIQNDGRILVAGAAGNGTSDVLGLVRINP